MVVRYITDLLIAPVGSRGLILITIPARNTLFAMGCAAQRSNTELVIHSRDASQYVQIAYPVSRGSRIVPVRFVTSATGHTYAVCHFRDHCCIFSSMLIILASYYLLRYFQSSLTRHNLRRCSNHCTITLQHESIVLLLITFRAIIASLPSVHTELAPYFVNYLGSHPSMHPQSSVMNQSLSPSFIQ